MKPKVLKSVRVRQGGVDYVEFLKGEEAYFTRYKYSSMKEPREKRFAYYENAELHFMKTAMFILSE